MQDRHEDLAKRLAVLPALTLEDILAKARAFQSMFPDDKNMAKELRDDLGKFGADTTAMALSLAGDLGRLARNREA